MTFKDYLNVHFANMLLTGDDHCIIKGWRINVEAKDNHGFNVTFNPLMEVIVHSFI